MASDFTCSFLSSIDSFLADDIIFLNMVQVSVACICWNPVSAARPSSRNPLVAVLRL
jgi:hypothetical protein